MSRATKLLGIIGLTAALVFTAFPASAREHTTTDTRREPLRLECRWVRAAAGPGVGCRWSPSQHPDFAEYRLVRGERGGERTVVFRSDQRRHTRHLDTTADPGQAYVYVVLVLDDRGEVIGRSQPAGVRPARTSPTPVLPERPEL